MELQIKAKLVQKFPVTTHGETFKKMEFILEIDGKYPQLVKMELHNDKILKAEDLPEGTIANWHFNLKGRKWTNPENKDIYFNSLVVWRVEVLHTDLSELESLQIHPNIDQSPLKTSELSDDLPF